MTRKEPWAHIRTIPADAVPKLKAPVAPVEREVED